MIIEPMQLILIALIVRGVASEWSPEPFLVKTLPMVWVDGRFRYNIPVEIDTLFDRLVTIYHVEKDGINETLSHKVTGVFIKEQLILTSFNAFRTVSSKVGTLNNMIVFSISGRNIDISGRTLSYTQGVRHKIECARQVIPCQPYETWPIHMRHGPHSPLHDLMIMRIDPPVSFVTPVPPVLNEFTEKTWIPERKAFHKDGFAPIKTILAKPGDKMFLDEMKFASIGHINDKHIKENGFLEVGDFGDIVDCDEWIPREWGLFICLQNTENYSGLASGAMLYSDTKLFGVGAFMLRKESVSILVFTDVRPYWHLLYRTCTNDDQELREPADLT